MNRRDDQRQRDFFAGVFMTGCGLVLLLFALCAVIGVVVLVWQGNGPAVVEFTGVPDDHLEVAQASFAAYPEPFSVEGGDPANYAKRVCLWEVPGVRERLNPGPQQTGDCASWAPCAPLVIRQCLSVATGKRGEIAPPFPPYIYGVGRVRNGQAQPACGRQGGYPSRIIEGLQADGWVTPDEHGQPYSGSLADRLGCTGPTPDKLAIGRKRAGLSAYPVRSVDELAEALVNTFPTTVAFQWRTGMRVDQRDGRSIVDLRTGRAAGGHALCIIGYDGSTGNRYWYLYNSHGPGWPSGARRDNGEPAGGCWIDEDDVRWIVETGQVWAISDVPGFVANELDLSIFDKLN
jgi:hypothetical protein